MVKRHLEKIPNEVLTVENLSILSVSGISPGHLIDWEELTAKLYRDKIPAAPGLVEYGKSRARIGQPRYWLSDPTADAAAEFVRAAELLAQAKAFDLMAAVFARTHRERAILEKTKAFEEPER